eukprot:SM005726S18595  [mRNA]  locus=s5726:650:895:- [translate_table: standard]
MGYARREDMLPSPDGHAGSLSCHSSFLRGRASACWQRAQAHALHQKAGRAL